MTGFPVRDGSGPAPDSWTEAVTWVGALLGITALLVFTGLDAQIQYMVSEPGLYFSGILSFGSSSVGDVEKVVLTDEAVSGMNFASSNSLGYDSIGSERGYCSGLREDGTVYDFRLADDIESSSRTSIVFSCGTPRELTVHSQPGFSGQPSEEDMSFSGEFQPEISCIQFREITVSPFNSKVSGINCWSTENGFNEVPVLVP